MATRSERLAAFKTDEKPAEGAKVEVLCEDHRGTYVLPFACYLAESGWCNAETNESLESLVIGWRAR